MYEFVVAVTGVSSTANGKTTNYLSNGDPTGQNTRNSLPVLLDTGSSAWTVPTSLYNDITSIFGNSLDDSGVIPCSHQNDNISLTLQFGGEQTIKVPVRDLIVPVYDPETNKQNTTTSGQPLCIFMLSPDYQGQQMEESGFLTLGDAVLRSMYVVFYLDNGQVSIAQAVANASTDASSSGSGNNIKVVRAGPSGVANAVGSANSGVATAAPNSYTIVPEVTASLSLSDSTVRSAVGTATGTAAIPFQGQANANPTSGGSSSNSGASSGSGSSQSAKASKGAAVTVGTPGGSGAVLGVAALWLAAAVFGAVLVL